MTDLIEPISVHITAAMKLKLVGNEQLKQGDPTAARETYIEGLKKVFSAVEKLKSSIFDNQEMLRENLKLAQEMDSIKHEIEDIRLQLISNLSLTEIKLELWSEAVSHSSMVIVADPLNIKALFRRSVARIRLGEQLEEALCDLEKVAERDSNNREVSEEIAKCKHEIKKRRPSQFTEKIKGTLRQEKKPSLLEGWGRTWMDHFGSVFAQCGGLRPESQRTTVKIEKQRI
jgi:tetratricopeptide (TPR) repeat protein